MGLTKFPSLVLLQPLANGFDTNFLCVEWPLGTFCQPLHRCLPEQEGAPPDIDLAIATITTTSQDFQDEVQMEQEHRHRRTAQLTEARQLREQQDREYEEALFQDQLAAVRRAEGEESQASPAADAVAQEEAAGEEERRAKQRAAEEAAAAAEAEEEAQRKQRGAEILAIPEAATGAEPTARIRLQLPSGERLQRNFRADQCLEEVYDWAHCCRPQAKPKRFELCISFPARTLTERSATLQELDLVPSAALVLREAES